MRGAAVFPACLPAYPFDLDEQARGRADRSVEIALNEGTGYGLSKLGFLPLVSCSGADGLVFLSSGSCKNPETYDSDEATDATARAAQFPYVMAVSRFAHYIRFVVANRIGFAGAARSGEGWSDAATLQAYLNRWIANYFSGELTEEGDTKAKLPLRQAIIRVAESPGRPGVVEAVAYLNPQFQLEALPFPLRVIVNLPPIRPAGW
jgi:type VI secretion system protein ImpC